MISENQMRSVLDAALTGGGDFAELFFEDREETNIRAVNSLPQGVKSIRICGVGLTVMAGTASVYLYSNHEDYESLMGLAARAVGLLQAKKRGEAVSAPAFEKRSFRNPNLIVMYPGDVSAAKKLAALRLADAAARGAGKVQNLNVDYFDNDQRILVANSEGLLTSDRRVNSRMRFQITLSDETGSYFEWDDYTKAEGFEAFADMEGCQAFAADLVGRVYRTWKAEPAVTCRVPVVMAAGACGTLWHECCGHGLEACAIARKNSIYTGMLGKRVASDKVTLIDDGTYPGLYGSSAIDDEGHQRQKNVLIENGILKQYLCDRLHGRMIGMESNGCGRRQNYTYAATSRMSNTYLAPGKDDEEEMIRSVPDGLFVQSLGGGTGGSTFTLSVKEGYLIRNGQIDRQVKGLMLSGNGLEVMQKVDRVGGKLETDMGGFCGAASGLIPTTTFQPMVRISEMTVTGEGGAK